MSATTDTNTSATSDTIAVSLDNLGAAVYSYFINMEPVETYHNVTGTAQTSVVIGSPENDLMTGVSGSELIGGAGNDALLGGAGNMTLFASAPPNSSSASSVQQNNYNALTGSPSASTDLSRSSASSVQAAGVDTQDNYNILSGGPGDTLWGGPGSDFFVFASRCGLNIINDFDPVPDQLVIQSNIDGSGITSRDTLVNHMTETSQGVVIAFSSSDRVLLAGVSMSDLRTDDFAFVQAS
jgi:Ca2+-binding RTX toxin-like protein